ncbi:MAG TPA: hypothetical protein VGW38_21865, partial [Chloroflexota bacterium]|nr:hypothetical protein [Chloroflexota bacterium]
MEVQRQNPRRRPRHGARKWLVRSSTLLATAALAASPMLGVFPAGAQGGAQVGAQIGAQVGSEANVAIGRIAGQPNTYMNRTVNVTGQVRQVFGPALGFVGVTLDDPSTSAMEQIFAVARAPQDVQISQGDQVQLSARVHIFDQNTIRQIEQETGLRLDSSDFQQMMGEPVLVARTITPVGGQAAQQRQQQQQQRQQQVGTGGATVAQIMRSAQQFVGQSVTLSGSVTDPLNRNAFVLENDLLVLSAQPLANITQRQGMSQQFGQGFGVQPGFGQPGVQQGFQGQQSFGAGAGTQPFGGQAGFGTGTAAQQGAQQGSLNQRLNQQDRQSQDLLQGGQQGVGARQGAQGQQLGQSGQQGQSGMQGQQGLQGQTGTGSQGTQSRNPFFGQFGLGQQQGTQTQQGQQGQFGQPGQPGLQGQQG